MVHKILCAVDGTKHSDKAVQFAAELANKLGSALTIATVNVLIGGARSGAIYALEDSEVQNVLEAAAKIATTPASRMPRRFTCAAGRRPPAS